MKVFLNAGFQEAQNWKRFEELASRRESHNALLGRWAFRPTAQETHPRSDPGVWNRRLASGKERRRMRRQ